MADKELRISNTDGLFQISEPVDAAFSSSRRSPGKAIGIDLGTTHSLVAWAPNGAEPSVLAVDEDRNQVLLPSVVSYVDETIRVGREALEHEARDPERVISSVKRFMGRGQEDIQTQHPYRIVSERGVIRIEVGRKKTVTPIEVSAEILRVLKARAEVEIPGGVDGAVITVPAYFDEAQRQATKDAGRLAGLQVLRLLAEPTAAALAYGLDQQRQGLFAVYDLGGGTFDISILRLSGGVFQVLATGGDTALGGDDFDRHLAQSLLEAAGVSTPTNHQYQEAFVQARSAKQHLSDHEKIVVDLPGCGLLAYQISRSTFESLIESDVRRTLKVCKATLKDAGLRPQELDGIVLVGGSTRVPLVRKMVEGLFGREPYSELDPDRVVALGAAIQADILSGSERPGVTLLDVVPLSLGLETMGGIVEVVIPRNATIPISARQTFTNYSEKQTGITINVVQGERELVQDCRQLASFELSGIPSLPPSMARIEVGFQLDADGLLTVRAKELMTGVQQSIEVKPTYGLAADEVNRMIAESESHAQEDFSARNLAEARVELGRVVLALRTLLQEVGHLDAVVSKQERSSLEEGLIRADELMRVPHAKIEDLKVERESLERTSEPLARRRMERALKSGMDGKSLGEIESTLQAKVQPISEKQSGSDGLS